MDVRSLHENVSFFFYNIRPSGSPQESSSKLSLQRSKGRGGEARSGLSGEWLRCIIRNGCLVKDNGSPL